MKQFKVRTPFILILLIALSAFFTVPSMSQTAMGPSKTAMQIITLDPLKARVGMAVGATVSGVTMGASGDAAANTGVSLIGLIDLKQYNPVSWKFSFQPGTMHLTQSTRNAAGAGGTSGTTVFSVYYAMSIDSKSATDWERPLRTGVTLIGSWRPDSANTPYPIDFTPEQGRYLALYYGHPTASTSPFCLSPYTPQGAGSGVTPLLLVR